MSSPNNETLQRRTKKKDASESRPSSSDGDHRRKRRNRTTQSCLNCHTSKRMKASGLFAMYPAGLTGLCVYEVDDPNQRSDQQDESARLIKRVAELEGVIREMKNKPHPRWLQAQDDSSDESTKEQALGSPVLLTPGGTNRGTSPLLQTPTFAASSPSSSSSTPPGDSSPNFFHGPQPDLASFLYPQNPLQPYRGGTQSAFPCGHLAEERTSGRCTCLTDPESYSTLLELSVRLRRTAQVMAQRQGLDSSCALVKRIAELDDYTSNHLTSQDLPSQRRLRAANYYESSGMPNISAMSPRAGDGYQWDMLSQTSYINDPAFMTWEPSSHPHP